MQLTQVLVGFASLLSVHSQQPALPAASPSLETLARVEYSLQNRHPVESVNDVFADNILLTLAYMRDDIRSAEAIQWDQVRQPNETRFILKPGDTFAFHDQVLEEYQSSLVQTTNAHFIWDEGFKSDGWLVGDGVCHLASFLHVAADQAGLEVTAPTRHDFATIPDVAKEDGTSIYFMPGNSNTSQKQNLYIKNTTERPVAFIIEQTSAQSLIIEVVTVSPSFIN
jgi:hypothetical protein